MSSIENFNQNIDNQPNLQDSPEYQEQLQEKVNIVEQEQKYATKLAKANDVLKVLDLPDEIDDTLRETLMTFDNNILEKLSTKSKNDIQTFLVNKNYENTNSLKQKQNIEQQEQLKKKDIIISSINDNEKTQNIEQQKQLQEIQKIKSILTPEILQKHSDLKEALNG